MDPMLAFMALEKDTEWSADEHARFVAALEKYGDGDGGTAWQDVATDVGGRRTLNDVKLHAHKYLQELVASSSAAASSSSAPGAAASLRSVVGALEDHTWTRDEDLRFEAALVAHHSNESHSNAANVGAAGDRWEQVAARLPGRTASDVRTRYQKMLVDVARIDAGQPAAVFYAPQGGRGGGGGGGFGGGSGAGEGSGEGGGGSGGDGGQHLTSGSRTTGPARRTQHVPPPGTRVGGRARKKPKKLTEGDS